MVKGQNDMAKQTCQQCQRNFEAPDSPQGATVTCPLCGRKTELPPVPGNVFNWKLPPIEASKGLELSEVTRIANLLVSNIERVIVGKHEQVQLAVATLFAEGHLLVEDVPGVAKTMLARTLAASAGCSFKRIQCTPDLHPGDVLGESSVDPETGRSEFRAGPLFAQVVLVDEINRASPRTQAAMLEAMGEGMISKGRVTYDLERPFMVLATQNPIDQEGTFRLPEAQLDRFLIRMSLGYPSPGDERNMCERFKLRHPFDDLKSVSKPEQILACQQAVRTVQIGPEIYDYVLAIVHATREHPALRLGASPRGSLGLLRCSQALATMLGQTAVTPAHIQALARPVLAHRLLAQPGQGDDKAATAGIIEEVLKGINRRSAT